MLKSLPSLAILLLLLAGPAMAQTVPVHGNWCGIGHSGGNGPYPAPPTDPLDAACMRHDICTAYRGRFDCGCDLGFMQELRTTRWPNPGLAEKARAIHEAIGVIPCTSPEGYARKMSLVSSDWLNDIGTGREAPWQIMERLSRLSADGMRWARW